MVSRVPNRWGLLWPTAPAACALILSACASAPEVAVDPDAVLTEVAAFLDAGDADAALGLLLGLEREQVPRPLRDRYSLSLGRAYYGTGQAWEAYKAVRDFADDHPHSELRSQVVELEFRAGRTLARSDDGFLFFSSDRRAGREVLEHLITRHPNNAFLAEALHILGEMAFADGDYPLAQARFLELMKRRPDSAWFPKARFRYAMSLFNTLQGPQYDLDQMRRARTELKDFIANPPENPEFVAEASAALTVVTNWLAERHLIIADFYKTVGNRPGERQHLERAAGSEFADTVAGRRAKTLLGSLPVEEAR